MEEAIFYIIRNKCHLSESSSIRLASRNITAHITQFIEYMIEDVKEDFDRIITEDNEWAYVKDGGFYNMSEVYDYWRINIFGTQND